MQCDTFIPESMAIQESIVYFHFAEDPNSHILREIEKTLMQSCQNLYDIDHNSRLVGGYVE